MASTQFSNTSLSRRRFLAGPLAATVLALQGRSRVAAAPVLRGSESETAAERIYRKLRGPVVPINIPLAKDYSVDLRQSEGLRGLPLREPGARSSSSPTAAVSSRA